MNRHFSCPQGHQWDDAPNRSGVSVAQAICPICGAFSDAKPPAPPSPETTTDDVTRTYAPALAAPDKERGNGPDIAGYAILGELGRGGMGVVYKAEHLRLKRLVALKMMLHDDRASPEELSRFRAEAEAVARLRHPHIVQIHGVGEHEGRPYFSLEYVEGGNLAGKLARTPLSARAAAELLETLARAVDAAHQHGIVHRDLKPANVLLTAQGVPKIGDFGLAKRLDDESGQTRTGAVMGTPSYMAPEQAEGRNREVGPLADVYALGAILYETLTGRPPFRAASVLETLDLVRTQEPVPPSRLQPNVSRDLDTICLKCLEKIPSKRYASAAELADDLRRFLDLRPIRARRVGWMGRGWRFYRRNPLPVSLALLVAVVLALSSVGGWALAERAWEAAANERTAKDEALEAQQKESDAKNEETKAKNEAVTKEQEANRRLVQMHVATGVRHMEDGDYFRALPWLAAALKEERDPARREVQRFRLAALVRQSPRLVQLIRHGLSPLQHVAFSPNGRFILFQGVSSVAVCDRVTHGLFTLNHSSGVIAAASFSSDSRWLATAGEDKTVRLWQTATGREIACLKHDCPVGHAVFSRDGRLVAICTAKTVRLWKLDESGSLVGPVLSHDEATGHSVFSPDGGRIATVSGRGTLRVWNAVTGEPVTSPFNRISKAQSDSGANLRAIVRLDFSPNGTRLFASGAIEGQVWDASNGKKLFSIGRLEGSGFLSVKISPDGLRIAACRANGNLVGSTKQNAMSFYDAHSGQRLAVWDQMNQVRDFVFSPDGRKMIVTEDDLVARVWDVETGKALPPSLPHSYAVRHAAFDPEGRVAITACDNGTAKVWDLVAGEPETRQTFDSAPLSISPDFRTVATSDDPRPVENPSSGIRYFVRLRELFSGKSVGPPLPHPQPIAEAAFSPDSSRLLTACLDGNVRVWEVATGRQVRPPLRHGGAVEVKVAEAAPYGICACWSHDGRRVATGGVDGTARLWELATGRQLLPPLVHEAGLHLPPEEKNSRWLAQALNSIQFSSDGRRLLTEGRRGTIRLWDVETGRPMTSLLPYSLENLAKHAPAWSRDGRRLAAIPWRRGDDWSSIQIWDGDTSKRLGPSLQQGGPLASLCFSPDGHRLVSAGLNRRAVVWDADTGEQLFSALTHESTVNFALFSPDGRQIATVSDDATARIWDAATGLPISPPLTHTDGVLSAWFSPDGRRLATIGNIMSSRVYRSNTIRVWDISGDDRPAEDWSRLAELLSSNRLDANDALALLKEDEMSARMGELRRRYPAVFSLASPQKVLAWHEREAKTAEADKRWFAAVLHLSRLIDAQPQYKLYYRRYVAYKNLNEKAKADADRKQLIRLYDAKK